MQLKAVPQPCANCAERVGTVWWGDTLAIAHGWGAMWCEVCVLRTQIAHAEERAAVLPGLRARLAELEATDA